MDNSANYFAKQMNLKEILQHYVPEGFCWCKNLNFLGEKGEDEAVDHKMDL